ncbi:hypothetical protein AQUCO_00400614v1 [Aquilegia coerulea]|uniref:F-box domain-containing protein n=1 Tax=Aquilegia coerulea TaxID=218851 RepID=A0A2G5EVU1_AQUCA|nr:hypothetical protein AQUCO_00400614v1 [Aquilegia coerulea]
MATTNINNNNGDELTTNLVLPEDIMFQILLWLPVVSLLRFKSVCKSWYSLIKSSQFISLHSNKGTQEDEENYNNHKLFILQSNPSGPECKLISSSSCGGGGGGGGNNTIYQASENLDIPEFLSIYDFSEVRSSKMFSCKGIICFLHDNWNVSLWNPATKQFRILPESQIPLPGKGNGFKLKIGFGFDAKTNDYKVVRFLYSIQNFHADDKYYDHVEVYSLSTNSWKTLDMVLSISHVEKDSDPKMPLRNGEIYCWIGGFDWDQSCVISFNFRTEVFDTILLPDDPTFPLDREWQLAILREKIAIVLINYEGDTTALPYSFNYQIWVMNEYGVKDSWSKVYTIGTFTFICKLIGFAMNGNLLLSVMDQEYNHQLCLCDLVTQQITNLPGQDSSTNVGVAVYKECLRSV